MGPNYKHQAQVKSCLITSSRQMVSGAAALCPAAPAITTLLHYVSCGVSLPTSHGVSHSAAYPAWRGGGGQQEWGTQLPLRRPHEPEVDHRHGQQKAPIRLSPQDDVMAPQIRNTASEGGY